MPLLEELGKVSGRWLRPLAYAIAALLIALLHLLLLPWMAILGVVPDLFLLLVLWIALRQGRFAGTIAGFAIGLLQDVLLADVLGLNAFAKSIAGFVAGMFAQPEDPQWMETTDPLRLLGFALVGIAFHNVAYFLIAVHPLAAPVWESVLKYGGVATGYTAAVAAVGLLLWRAFRRRTISER